MNMWTEIRKHLKGTDSTASKHGLRSAIAERRNYMVWTTRRTGRLTPNQKSAQKNAQKKAQKAVLVAMALLVVVPMIMPALPWKAQASKAEPSVPAALSGGLS